jgi:hypothetical protein
VVASLAMPSIRSLGVVLFVSSGCASLPRVTSGQIGCPEGEIVISDHQPGWNTETWTAKCRNQTFYCSSVGGESRQVSCKEDTAGAPPDTTAVTPAGGCEFDTQCKGDRICQQGTCVDPAPSVSVPADPTSVPVSPGPTSPTTPPTVAPPR